MQGRGSVALLMHSTVYKYTVVQYERWQTDVALTDRRDVPDNSYAVVVGDVTL